MTLPTWLWANSPDLYFLYIRLTRQSVKIYYSNVGTYSYILESCLSVYYNADTPFVKVSQVKVAVVNATAVEVSWEFMTSPGQSVSKFVVYYTAVKGLSVIHSFSETVSGEMTSKILMINSGVQLEHRFEVAGIAITSDGDSMEGEKSEVVAIFLGMHCFTVTILLHHKV